MKELMLEEVQGLWECSRITQRTLLYRLLLSRDSRTSSETFSQLIMNPTNNDYWVRLKDGVNRDFYYDTHDYTRVSLKGRDRR